MSEIQDLGQLEPCFTPAAIAKRWRVDPATVRRKLKTEKGCLIFQAGNRTTLRVPRAVLDAIERRIEVKG